jgi:catechol 2,3-dioxygenase-like lactoylglutathione lyase family enzyme
MTIVLDHTIVPVPDRYRSARLLADMIGVKPGPAAGPFVPVQVNPELTFDFDERFGARPGHYAFLVDNAIFDRALGKAVELDLEWGSTPRSSDRQIDQREGGRRVYIRDPGGIAYEFFTASGRCSRSQRSTNIVSWLRWPCSGEERGREGSRRTLPLRLWRRNHTGDYPSATPLHPRRSRATCARTSYRGRSRARAECAPVRHSGARDRTPPARLGNDFGGRRGEASKRRSRLKEHPKGFGRIRLQRIDDVSKDGLIPFVESAVESGATVHTGGWQAYWTVRDHGDEHERTIMRGQHDPATS